METFFQKNGGTTGWWSAQIRDISVGGLGLVLVHRLEPGTTVTVGLPSKKSGLPRILPGRVMHVQQNNGAWTHGCAFANHLTEHQLQDLLS
jgi:hypothetical protein